MKKYIYLACCIGALALGACGGDDDDENKPNNGGANGEDASTSLTMDFNSGGTNVCHGAPATAVDGLRIASYDEKSLRYDNRGRLITNPLSYDSNDRIIITDGSSECEMRMNDDGCITYYSEKDSHEELKVAYFYNNEKRMTKMCYLTTEGKYYEKGFVTLSYSNGNLTKAVISYEENDDDANAYDDATLTFSYDNAPDNKYNLWLDDSGTRVSVYYEWVLAGVLGKGSAKLPTKIDIVETYKDVDNESGETETETKTMSVAYSYTFNNDGSPATVIENWNRNNKSYQNTKTVTYVRPTSNKAPAYIAPNSENNTESIFKKMRNMHRMHKAQH